ncbi:hypothetical protein [Niastella vici]|nr:hypothetical protein [Niastella vici]
MNKNSSYWPGLVFLFMVHCNPPMSITANPDDQTNAAGTLGSAKMTTQMPPKNNNVRLKPDTIKLPNDTVIVKPSHY